LLERIYDYIDGGLSAGERASFEAHLAGCSACRAALAERRAIAEAAVSLPDLDVPDDFVQGVMSRLFLHAGAASPAKRARPFRFGPVLAGASALGGVAVTLSLITGNGLFGIFFGAGRVLRTIALSSSQGVIKAAKLALVFGRMAVEAFSRLLEGFMIASSFIGPEVQIAAVVAVLAGTIAAGLLYGRKLQMEKDHEQI
jgi:anti-sigma factor RsiW